MTTKELLDQYEEASDGHDIERALWCLLKANEKHITGLIEDDETGHWFHKAHRVLDVCENVYMDMAIWILIDNSILFWKIIEENQK